MRELFPAAVAVEQDRRIDDNDEVSAGFVGGIAADEMNDDTCDASSRTISGEAKKVPAISFVVGSLVPRIIGMVDAARQSNIMPNERVVREESSVWWYFSFRSVTTTTIYQRPHETPFSPTLHRPRLSISYHILSFSEQACESDRAQNTLVVRK